ncbi:hypothetical protein HPB47_016331 [Ixodes persulcatus]|uniref:Uncharacterized protein n=1 Tax=Ixodes persulcatus TaxID=34615 RepID=A0AC60QS43_IXOPE|nr:hypothetical protein HPB47_016331 [Ixodes persulcatus]
MMLAEKGFLVLFVLLAGESECNAGDSDKKLAQEQNHFALKLLKELSSEETESNLFFSPTSISVALAMVYAGARGKSEAELSTAFGHTAAGLYGREFILATYKKILAEQQTDENVSFTIANAVFVKKTLKVLESYQKELVDIFAAMFRSVDVGAENSAMESEVNEWVKNKTRGKISGFKIPGNTVMALLNAIYFKGLWNTPFNPKYTSPLPFYNKGSEEVKVLHKAAIEVNEEGTVATAATAVAMPGSLPPTFAVNRPFLFYIFEKATGRVLFLGEVHELPAAKVEPTLASVAAVRECPGRESFNLGVEDWSGFPGFPRDTWVATDTLGGAGPLLDTASA